MLLILSWSRQQIQGDSFNESLSEAFSLLRTDSDGKYSWKFKWKSEARIDIAEGCTGASRMSFRWANLGYQRVELCKFHFTKYFLGKFSGLQYRGGIYNMLALIFLCKTVSNSCDFRGRPLNISRRPSCNFTGARYTKADS